jgi:preprotein translocase subunit SecF
MLDIVGKRYLFFAISLLVILPGLISLVIPPHLMVGIDFTGGTYWEVVPKPPNIGTNQVNQLLKSNDHPEALVQNANIIVGQVTTPTLIMRMGAITPEEKGRLAKILIDNNIVAGEVVSSTVTGSTPAAGATGTVTATGTTTATTQPAGTTSLVGRIPAEDEIQYSAVGATVGNEVAGRAVGAVAVASLGILAYLWYAFRRVPNALRYGVCAVIALVHDVLVVLGIFSILGRLFNVEVDALFITAMLTVIGFSVHDTIVVFDRVRENLLKRRFDSFEKVVNYSLVQTLTRSINTSLTVIFTLLALYLFGGVSIRNFVLALLIGIVSGTFSSIFNASLLLVVWENREWRNWFGGRGRTAAPAEATRARTV